MVVTDGCETALSKQTAFGEREKKREDNENTKRTVERESVHRYPHEYWEGALIFPMVF